MNPQDQNSQAKPEDQQGQQQTSQTQSSDQQTQQTQQGQAQAQQQQSQTAPTLDENAITEKVSKGVFEKLSEAFGLSKKQAEEQLPTDPKELLRLAEQRGSEAAKKILEDREKETQEAEEAREAEVTEGAKRYQSLWTGQYDELASSGRVPKITNAKDSNDPGMVAKSRILLKMKQIIDENAKNGIDYVPTLKEVFYENPNVINIHTTEGNNAPVSGGGRSTSPNNGLTYNQLHNTSTEDLLKSKYQG